METLELSKLIFNEAGAIVFLSLVVDGVFVWLLLNERKDKNKIMEIHREDLKTLWKAHSSHVDDTNTILGELLTALELLKARLK